MIASSFQVFLHSDEQADRTYTFTLFQKFGKTLKSLLLILFKVIVFRNYDHSLPKLRFQMEN